MEINHASTFWKIRIVRIMIQGPKQKTSLESSATCVKFSNWVLHGRNQTSSLEVWDWISSDQNHYQIKEFSDSQDSDANWCQDRNNAFQKKYCPTSVTFPIEMLMEENKPGLRRKMSLNFEAEQSKHFSEISDYQDSKVGNEINDFLNAKFLYN